MSRKNQLNELLYKIQISGYRFSVYKKLIGKITTGMVKLTPRIERLKFMTYFLTTFGLGFPWFCLAYTVAFANWLMQPYEKLVQIHYLRRARKILNQRPDLIIIGITGSYGKTSVKNILTELLKTKYRVVASPASFNTPMGLARTVNENLRPDTQILILEMGARRVGEIQELCHWFQPQHGIITSIGACHLATFGNLETVAKTKAELFSNLPSCGWAVTDGDNVWCQKLKHPNLIWVKNSQQSNLATNLLGQHQQKNLQMATALALKLGIKITDIERVALNLPSIPHRLEKIIAPNGIIIFDDSYNANPASAQSALEVISNYQTRKVVQTPGFVEQGSHSSEAHAVLCEKIKSVADAVIVVGSLNRQDFERGLAGWKGDVVFVSDRESAKKIYPQWLHSGDILLILNDIPEQY